MKSQSGTRVHPFYAVAFEENLSLRQVAAVFPEARVTPHELRVPITQNGTTGDMYVFPFGAVVTRAVPVDFRQFLHRHAGLCEHFRAGRFGWSCRAI